MFKTSIAFFAVILSTTFLASANAQPKHALIRHGRTIRAPIVCNRFGCSDWAHVDRVKRHPVLDANGNRVIGRRPPGCPHAFCGCEASLYLFGKIRPNLNLAANWLRNFPRAMPAPGMVAARRHHVMVLMRHVSGSKWLVHDGNSGGGLTREHVVSIRGYTIVDPHGSRLAKQGE